MFSDRDPSGARADSLGGSGAEQGSRSQSQADSDSEKERRGTQSDTRERDGLAFKENACVARRDSTRDLALEKILSAPDPTERGDNNSPETSSADNKVSLQNQLRCSILPGVGLRCVGNSFGAGPYALDPGTKEDKLGHLVSSVGFALGGITALGTGLTEAGAVSAAMNTSLAASEAGIAPGTASVLATAAGVANRYRVLFATARWGSRAAELGHAAAVKLDHWLDGPSNRKQ